MTTEELKAELRQARNVDKRIKELEESAQRAFARITSATQKISETGVHASSREDAMAEYTAFTDEIYREIARLNNVKRETFKIISQLKKYEYQNVLHLYYIDCMTWEQVAVEMSYSWRWTMKLRDKALKKLAEIETRNERKRGHRKDILF